MKKCKENKKKRLWALKTFPAVLEDPCTLSDTSSASKEAEALLWIHVVAQGSEGGIKHIWIKSRDQDSCISATCLAKRGAIRFLPTRDSSLWVMALSEEAFDGSGRQHWKSVMKWLEGLKEKECVGDGNSCSILLPSREKIGIHQAGLAPGRKSKRKRKESVGALIKESEISPKNDKIKEKDLQSYCTGSVQRDSPGMGAEFQSSSGTDVATLYSMIAPSEEFMPCLGTNPKGLKAVLRPYQSRGVSWMVWRETKAGPWKTQERILAQRRAKRILCCQEATDSVRDIIGEDKVVTEKCFLFDEELGILFQTPEETEISLQDDSMKVDSIQSGTGILADEMGLGKSIELISTILLNPWKPSKHHTGINVRRDGGVGCAELNHSCRELPANRTCLNNSARLEVAGSARSNDSKWNTGNSGADPSSYSQGANAECLCGISVGSTDVFVSCVQCAALRHISCIPIAKNRKNQDIAKNKFICGECTVRECASFSDHVSRSTLIVCPSSILQQWKEELSTHVVPNTLRVVIYEGQPQQASAGHFLGDGLAITASDLAEADVVVTTYDTLRKDLHLNSDIYGTWMEENSTDTKGRVLRRKKKYQIIPTPLTRLCWWRICLDEAQMVESPVAMASEMAQRLRGVHRWCITGTPIQKGLEDLFGLLSFLGWRASPYFQKHVWSSLVQKPLDSFGTDTVAFRELCDLMKDLMLRRSRELVSSELHLPVQGDIATFLKMSAVEMHWYRKLHAQCTQKSDKILQTARRQKGKELSQPSGYEEKPLTSTCQKPTPIQMAAAAAERRAKGSCGVSNSFEDGDKLRCEEHSDDLKMELSARDAKNVLAPILALRQACCHPQIGVHGITGGLSSSSVLGMDEIHTKLIEKARLEAEEVQRLLFMTMNGIAALKILDGDILGGISIYREVLAHSEENLQKDRLRTDPLQKLHVLHNLLVLLQSPTGGGAVQTTRDGSLAMEEQEIRKKYLSDFQERMMACVVDFQAARKQCNQYLQKKSTEMNKWWLLLLQEFSDADALQFLDRLTISLEESWQGKLIPFQDIAGLQFTIQRDLDAIHEKRCSILVSLDKAIESCENPSDDLILRSGNCGQCRDFGAPEILCMNCELDKQLEEYEDLLYGKQIKSAIPGRLYIDQADVGAGRNEPSSAEKSLRMMRGVFRSRKFVEERKLLDTELFEIDQLAQQSLLALENLRKEYPRMRSLCRHQSGYLGALDEVRMSTQRIRLRFPEELPQNNNGIDPLPAHMRTSCLCVEEVPIASTEYTQQKAIYEAELDRAKSQLRFLSSLQSHNDCHVECPICREHLDGELSVFPCGHRLCVACSMTMVQRIDKGMPYASHTFFCPECRCRIHLDEINYVGQRSAVIGASFHQVAPQQVFGSVAGSEWLSEVNEKRWPQLLKALDENTCISGSWGTKIDAIVKRILLLQSGRPGDKILAFSEWQEVLTILAAALEQNGIPFIHIRGKAKFNSCLANFRRKDGPRVLLLPFSLGANGLNIVEAQHVVLIEPSLDPGVEAQAIKRVDRIGQTLSTCVHRFLIHGTVEENVYAVNHKRRKATIGGLHDVKYKRHINVSEVQALLDNPTGKIPC